MSQPDNNAYVDYFIIFDHEYYRPHWLFRYLKPCFRHVYAIRRSHCGLHWIIITSRYNFLDIYLKSTKIHPTPRSIGGPDAVILPVRSILTDKTRHGICFYSCVEAVKAVLGIKKFFIFTPWQLYQYLMRDEHVNREKCREKSAASTTKTPGPAASERKSESGGS